MSDFILRFLTRPGCHLCDDARPLVKAAAERENAILEEVDVDTSPELETEYGNRIPVLLDASGRVVAEGVIDDRRQLRKRIKRSARVSG